MTVKMIYLAKRNPDTTHEEFRENWKGHSRLGGSFPGLRSHFDRIEQCAVVSGGPLGTAPAEHDGANLLTMGSMVEAAGLMHDPAQPTMQQDERRVFSRLIPDVMLTTDETVLYDGPTTGVVYLQFVRRDRTKDAFEFIGSWSADFAAAMSELPAFGKLVRRYVHNHTVLPTVDTFDWDGVSELWFDSAADAHEFLSDPGYRALADTSYTWTSPDGERVLCEINSSWIRATDA